MAEEAKAKAASIASRSSYKGKITAILKEAEPFVSGRTPYDEFSIVGFLTRLRNYYEKIESLDRLILEKCEDEAALNKFAREAVDYIDNLSLEILKIQRLYDSQQTPSAQPVVQHSSSSGGSNVRPTYKLATFEMQSYNGEPMKWRGWWDVYKQAIHENSNLSSIEKFTYLLGYLKGEALAVAEGYELSATNYDVVISDLQERYGDEQRAQFAHFEALFEIEKAGNKSLAEVRRVSDECERHIRSLVALGLDEEQFCICFIPLLLKKLPQYLSGNLSQKRFG